MAVVDSINHFAGQRLLPKDRVDVQQIFENEPAERNRMSIASRVIMVHEAVVRVAMLMLGQPASEFLRCRLSHLPPVHQGLNTQRPVARSQRSDTATRSTGS